MLKNLAMKYGSDKHNHNHTFNGVSYPDVYESYFHPIREEKLNVLEIGVLNGSSLNMWKEYFPNSNIFGLDINPKCKMYESDRVTIKIGSQDDIDFLSKEFKDVIFDIIIDDGSHVNTHIIKTFNYLYHNKLKSGGIYSIEDLECSYCKLQTDFNVYDQWSGMNLNKDNNFDNDRQLLNSFLFKLIQDMDFKRGNCHFINFHSQQCVIKKT
jgi:hypothetical protein